jgi:hypothetical protein
MVILLHPAFTFDVNRVQRTYIIYLIFDTKKLHDIKKLIDQDSIMVNLLFFTVEPTTASHARCYTRLSFKNPKVN